MGFFKKVFGGVAKTFRKIGRGIKKVVGKIGQFMNKIGIVGQIAMAFILPGIGNMLMNGIGGIASSMVTNTLGGIGGAIVKGAGHVVSAAHKFVTVGKNAFNTVTQGVTKFVGEFTKTALNKIPGVNIQSASKNFFGTGGAWDTVQKDITKNYKNIMNPFKSTVNIKEGMDIKDVVNSTGVSKQRIQDMNIGVDLNNLKVGESLNFDAGSIGKPMTGDQIKELTGVDFGGTTPKPDYLSAQDVRNMTGVDFGGGTVSPSVARAQAGAEAFGITDPLTMDQSGVFGPPPAPLTPTAPYTQAEIDSMNLGFDTRKYQTSILSAPNNNVPLSSIVPDPDPGVMQRMWTGAKGELENRYSLDKPFTSAYQAAQDIATAQAVIEPEVDYDTWGSYSAPMYLASGAQDYDVTVQSPPRNFQAYSSMGQYGSTARIYDTILMNPVSTWSRDLSSRFA
jgi:hypothetical protein